MWPDLRPGLGDIPLRSNPFAPPAEVPVLQLTLDHLLDPGVLEEDGYLRELLRLDGVLPVRQAGSFPGVGGLEFEFLPLDGYPERMDESCRVRSGDGRETTLWMPRTLWDSAYLEGREPPGQRSPEARETRAFALAALSSRLGSHVLVTGRRGLLSPGAYFRSNPATVQEALAIIGLHMRTHGDSVLRNESGVVSRASRRTVEDIETARLLPTLRVHARADSATSTSPTMASACIERMTRLLRARDNVMVAETMAGPSPWVDPAVDAEAAAIAFTAGLDALARFVRNELSWKLDNNSCGFHKRTFHAKLRKEVQSTDQRASLEQSFLLAQLVAELRNTLHAEPLGRALFRRDGRGPNSVVLVGREIAETVARCSSELSIQDRWFREADDGALLLDPFSFVNDITAALAAISESIALWLPRSGDLVTNPARAMSIVDPVSESNMKRVAWLYGLRIWSANPEALKLGGTGINSGTGTA